MINDTCQIVDYLLCSVGHNFLQAKLLLICGSICVRVSQQKILYPREGALSAFRVMLHCSDYVIDRVRNVTKSKVSDWLKKFIQQIIIKYPKSINSSPVTIALLSHLSMALANSWKPSADKLFRSNLRIFSFELIWRDLARERDPASPNRFPL